MLGIKLRQLRKARGLSQKETGKLLGVSTSAVGMYEQGRREPDHETLAEICRLFSVSSDYFVMGGPVNPDLSDIIEDFRSRLLSQDGLMFNGVPLTDQDIAQVISAIEVGTMVAVEQIKRKPEDGKEG